MTTVRVAGYCNCPFSAVIEFAENALNARTEMRVPPGPSFSERVTFTSRSVDDRTDEVRRHDALLLAWKPKHRTLFPDFRGVLRARMQNRGVQLRLEGRYQPPFRSAGRLFDTLIGRKIARRTLQQLLDELTADIERRWQQFRFDHQPVAEKSETHELANH